MKRLLGCCAILAYMLISQASASAQSNRQPVTSPEPKKLGGVVTLYSLDPLAHAFCFHDGQEGLVIQQSEIRNRCSNIDFDSYHEGNLTVGVEGGQVGSIIDLGTDEDLKQKYGYAQSSLAKGQGFAVLRMENGRLVTLKDRQAHTSQEVTEAADLFAEGKSLATAPVKVGHVYLIRLTDIHDRSFQLLAKILVLAYTPNSFVTIRWQVL
jgi:hypothetical protein